MIEVHCSRLGIIDACPPAAIPPQVRVNTSHAASIEGTVCHVYQRSRIEGTAMPFTLEDLAVQYGADIDSLRYPVAWLVRWWEEYGANFIAPVCEHRMTMVDGRRGITLVGTTDCISPSREGQHRVCIVDWKAGWLESDATAQVKGYGRLALEEDYAVDEVYAVVPRPRLNSHEGYLWSRAELLDWWDALAERIAAAGANRVIDEEEFAPGPRQCRYCPRVRECPAVGQLVRAARNWFAEVVIGGAMAELDDAELLTLRETAKSVVKLCETVDGLVREQVAARGGKVRVGDWELGLTETKWQAIDYQAGRVLLQDYLGGELEKALNVAKEEARKIVFSRSPKRQGAKTWKELLDRLESAGALRTTIQERLECNRVDSSSETTGNLIAGPAGTAAAE